VLRLGIRKIVVLLAVAAVVAGCAAAGSASSTHPHLAKGHWVSGFALTEYWPVPESWFRGQLVSAPGLPGTHRVDWLYSGTGLLMEADGITLAGQRVHVDDFGKETWVNAAGKRTKATSSGNWTKGDPAWRVGGWRNASGAVTFPLEAGGWSNGPAASYTPLPKVRFTTGPSLPLQYWHSVATDPKVIPAGSRIYIPAYKKVNGGWFTARDTGSGIVGRHVDVFRPPPSSADGGNFFEHQRVYVIR
jgi:3D (Asp-Asp-Asp) domain-containing protein